MSFLENDIHRAKVRVDKEKPNNCYKDLSDSMANEPSFQSEEEDEILMEALDEKEEVIMNQAKTPVSNDIFRQEALIVEDKVGTPHHKSISQGSQSLTKTQSAIPNHEVFKIQRKDSNKNEMLNYTMTDKKK